MTRPQIPALPVGIADDVTRSSMTPRWPDPDGHERSARTEPMLALINVAFLLLVFMLLLGPANPVAPGVTMPKADATLAGEPGMAPSLALDSEGQAWAGAVPIARERLADWVHTQRVLHRKEALQPLSRIDLVADAALEAGELARVLAALADAGVAQVHLLTKARSLPSGDVAPDR